MIVKHLNPMFWYKRTFFRQHNIEGLKQIASDELRFTGFHSL
jgi:hypothetical protein